MTKLTCNTHQGTNRPSSVEECRGAAKAKHISATLFSMLAILVLHRPADVYCTFGEVGNEAGVGRVEEDGQEGESSAGAVAWGVSEP
jgi:hypothetical protein